jgi:signal transduction histidine kinase/DNA-binding response OmpR family regulator
MIKPRPLAETPAARSAAAPGRVDGPVARDPRERPGQLRELIAHQHGQPFLDGVHPADRERVAAALSAVSADASRLDEEFRLVGPGGEIRWVRARDCEVRDEQSGRVRTARIAEDVTDQRLSRDALDARLIDAQKLEAVAQLASGAARDFNDRLSVIMGNSDLMIQALSPDHPAYANAVEIQRAAEHAARLTRLLLIFSRRQAAQFGVLDLNDLVHRVDALLRNLIDDRIEMSVTCGARVGRILADAGYIEQVLINMVVNARHAMPSGGRLAISTSDVSVDAGQAAAHPGGRAGDFVRLTVTDTGAGMTEPIRAHLFDGSSAPHSSGLGLAVCHAIVTQVGGHIDVQSAPGAGATFHVYFPVADAPRASSTSAADQAPPRGTETVLVVDDEAGVRRLTCAMLAAQGYSVLSAVDGLDGLRVAREHRGAAIGLVVADIVMPQMGGQVMAEWLHSADAGLKVLFTSGYSDQAIAKRGVLDPGVAFLSKPYTRAAIALKVREALDAPVDAGRAVPCASGTGIDLAGPTPLPVPCSSALPPRRHAPGGETVLFVESDPTLREIAAELLRRQGYVVLTAADEPGAISVVEQHGSNRIDLLITDLPTPDVDGGALRRRIDARQPDTKTLFLSASGDDAALLKKPFTPNGLATSVRQALDQ